MDKNNVPDDKTLDNATAETKTNESSDDIPAVEPTAGAAAPCTVLTDKTNLLKFKIQITAEEAAKPKRDHFDDFVVPPIPVPAQLPEKQPKLQAGWPLCMDLSTNLLLGCGEPILCHAAKVPTKLLRRYHFIPSVYYIVEDQQMPIFMEVIQKYDPTYYAGGAVLNALRVFQWVIERRYASTFFGCVGSDANAHILKHRARAHGVNVRFQYLDDTPTGISAILDTGEDTSELIRRGASCFYSSRHMITGTNKAYIKTAENFYVSAYFLCINHKCIFLLAREAHSRCRPFLMNMKMPFCYRKLNEIFLQVFPYVDIVFGNTREVLSFASVQKWKTTDIKEIGKKMVYYMRELTRPPRIVVITNNHHPVLLIRQRTVEEFPVNRLEPHQITDKIGANEAFIGGFLSQFVQGKRMSICVRCGIWAAGQVIQQTGCMFEGKADFAE